MDDTARQPLPTEPSDRAFALIRRLAMATRELVDIVVVEDAKVVAEAKAPVASVSALIALKSVAIPRRAASNHPEKVASDIHDLVRLVEGRDLDGLAHSLAETEADLAKWIGSTLVNWFAPDRDQRYTLARVRRLSNSIDSQAIDEGVLSIVAVLGQGVLGELE